MLLFDLISSEFNCIYYKLLHFPVIFIFKSREYNIYHKIIFIINRENLKHILNKDRKSVLRRKARLTLIIFQQSKLKLKRHFIFFTTI